MIFEKASRMKLRFQHRGTLSVEDLWDLRLEDLDSIFKGLNAKAKVQQEESLLVDRSHADQVLDLSIEIVKHIVTVRLREAGERQDALERRARKAKLMTILEQKQDAELHDLPPDKLQEMISELG